MTVRLPLLPCLLAGTLLAAPQADAAVRLEKVDDFTSPVYVASAPGDHRRLYVVEKAGTIRVFRSGAKLAAPFVDLRATVSDDGERGFLSMAFRPDFARSRLLYVYYTDNEGDIRVDELRASDADRADPGHRRVVIEIPHRQAANHNGGTIQFGPDGFLYLAPGDGGHGQSGNALNLGSLLGKVLRIDPIPGGGYRVPPGNPFAGPTAGADEVWSYGLRNPFRFSFDRATGDLALGDVGASTTEEIDFAPAASGRGRGVNFGWPYCEGGFFQGTRRPCSFGTRPVIEQTQSDGWRAITGGYVVRDPTLPSLRGRYLYGDTYKGELRSAVLGTPRAADDRPVGLKLEALAGFGEDARGCLYGASLNGPVYRLVETAAEVPCAAPPQARGRAPARPPRVDRSAPRLRFRVPRRQRVRRARGVVAYARCDERCSVGLSARLRIGRRSYSLRYTRREVAPGRRLRLRAALTRPASRALGRALRSRRRGRRRGPTVRVALRARDRAGNRSALRRGTVRVAP